MAVLGVVLAMMLFSLGLLKEGSVAQPGDPTSCEATTSYMEAEKLQFEYKLPGLLSIDVERLQEQIDTLSLLSDDPSPLVTRILFTATDLAARRYVKSLMEAAGLEVNEDAIGNIYGRWQGHESLLPGVLTGSHTDAIPHAGKYDGVVGVLGAIEAIAALKASGFVPKRSIEVIMFTSEEPTRFGFGCLGSRMMANVDGMVEKLTAAVDAEGLSFAEAAAAAAHPDALQSLSEVVLPKGSLSAFVELHIEQGPILEEEGISIGVVTAIAAPASLVVEFTGEGGHAGAQLMSNRTDAGLAAAELALVVERSVLESGAPDTVGTTGKVDLAPNAVNSVPRFAHIEIDVRDIDLERRDSVVTLIEVAAKEIAARRGVVLQKFQVVNADPPAQSGSAVVEAVESAAEQLGLGHRRMVSRAYHDALFMARIAPIGMIFIPCRGGVSHRPDEFASPEDIGNGVHVLALTLAALSLQ
eukprot:TRINITY_DN18250_c0_g1_i1.p1 TRINITY_DN18250_c0_g1~~TRINITY_DN18250_c0_g1_i1.p1  ORF type:complete len:510 (+),score=72.47 TRINITY_DN18250_c0_g1_i1:121-1530(+)